MARIVTVRGEGGWTFEVDLDLNPAIVQKMEAGLIVQVDAPQAAAAGEPAAAADAAPEPEPAAEPAPAPKPRQPRQPRKPRQK
jgi:hypothetical protein